MFVRNLGAVLLLTVSVHTHAESLDIAVSGDTAQLMFARPLGDAVFNNAELDLGLLYTDNNDLVGLVGIQVRGEAGSGSPGLSASVGLRFYGVSTDNYDVMAIPLGLGAEYAFPSLSRLKLGGSIYYAPDIITFSDGENFTAFDARVGYEILPQASVFIGYRRIKADSTLGPEINVDKGGYVGLMMTWL